MVCMVLVTETAVLDMSAGLCSPCYTFTLIVAELPTARCRHRATEAFITCFCVLHSRFASVISAAVNQGRHFHHTALALLFYTEQFLPKQCLAHTSVLHLVV